MKKTSKLFYGFILLFFSFCLLKTNVLAKPIGDNWSHFNEKSEVSLSKSWKISFSDKISLDKIDGIVIEKNNTFIPININIINNNSIKVTPVNNYEANSRYCMKIFLNNNKKYFMYFNTIKEDIYSLGKDITYMNFEKSNITSNFTTVYNNNVVEPLESNILNNPKLKDNIGNIYSNGIVFYDSDGISSLTLEYPLLNKFKRFKGKIGVSDLWKTGKGSLSVKIYADEDKLYDKSWNPSYFPEKIDLNVKHAEKLIIKIDGKGLPFKKHTLCIYNPVLIK